MGDISSHWLHGRRAPNTCVEARSRPPHGVDRPGYGPRAFGSRSWVGDMETWQRLGRLMADLAVEGVDKRRCRRLNKTPLKEDG